MNDPIYRYSYRESSCSGSGGIDNPDKLRAVISHYGFGRFQELTITDYMTGELFFFKNYPDTFPQVVHDDIKQYLPLDELTSFITNLLTASSN